MSNIPTTTDEAGRIVAATPLRIVADKSAPNEVGQLVDSLPIRIVTGKIDTLTGKPLSVLPIVQLATLTTTDESGRPISVQPARIVAGLTTTDAIGRTVEVVPVRDIGSATVTLGALTITGPFQVGVATSGVITVATSGSTITGPAGITVFGSGTTRGYSGTPTTAGPSAFIETLAGATNSPNSTAVTVAVGAAPATFTMTQLAAQNANRIYQRATTTGGGQGKGQGAVAVALSAATVVGTVYARRRSASDGTTIVQAAWLAATLVATGAQTVSITGVDVPAVTASAPVQANDGYFYLDLSGDGVTWQNGTVAIGMGDLSILWGQSQSAYLLTKMSTDATTISAAGVSISPYGRVFAQYSGVSPAYSVAVSAMTWELPADAGHFSSCGVTEQLRCMINTLGCAVGLAGNTAGGSVLAQWQSGQANMTTLLAILAAAGNSFRYGMSFIGTTDSLTAGITASAYRTALTSAWGAIESQINTAGGLACPNRVITACGYINSTLVGDITQLAEVRKAAKAYADANGWGYLQTEGVACASDGTHQLQAGSIAIARDWYRANRPYMGYSTSNVGAVVSGTISRSAAVITVPMSRTLAAAVGSPGFRMRVFDQGNLNKPRKVSSVSTSGANLLITLAADPGVGWVGDLYLFPDAQDGSASQNGAANMLYDMLIEADETALGFTVGRQVQPTIAMDATITIPAITPGGAVNPLPAYTITALSAFSYAAGGSGFGNEITAGSGNTSPIAYSGNIPSPNIRSQGAFLMMASPPAANTVMVGFPDGNWIGFNSSGNLILNGSTVLSATNYADGTRRWVMLTQDATTLKVYVNGTQIYSSSVVGRRTYNSFGLRCTAGGTFANNTLGAVDEVVLFDGISSTATPATPFTGAETGCIALYHCDSGTTAADSATATK